MNPEDKMEQSLQIKGDTTKSLFLRETEMFGAVDRIVVIFSAVLIH